MHVYDSPAESVDDVLYQRNIFDLADQFFHAFAFAEKLIDVKLLMQRFGARFFVIEIFGFRFFFQSRRRRGRGRDGCRLRVSP